MSGNNLIEPFAMDNNSFRIVFMGTPKFAQESLREIIAEGLNVVGIITAPDKPSGRGRKVLESAVKKYAVEKNIPVLQPPNLKNPEFLEKLKKLEAHLNVVVAFRMLPKAVWAMPENGTINLHASLLPDYRGAAPINRVIMNGEKKTGVTTFFIEKEIDTGNILYMEEVNIPESMNAGELHDILMKKGAGLLIKTINSIISGNKLSVPQERVSQLNLAPKIYPEDCKIPWQNNVHSIYNHIRGLSPYPGAWTEISTNKDERFILKIYSSEIELKQNSFNTPSVIKESNKAFEIAVPGGIIRIKELQVPGKKKMNIQDFLRGNSIEGWKIS